MRSPSSFVSSTTEYPVQDWVVVNAPQRGEGHRQRPDGRPALRELDDVETQEKDPCRHDGEEKHVDPSQTQ